jgi:Skp family chaperone for outer membrane proteins
MNLFRRVTLCLSLSALAVSMAAPVVAAPKDRDPNAPAYVDIGKVLTAYRKTPAFAKYGQKVREQTQVYSQEMETLAQFRYLNEADRKEAVSLKAKPNPTPKDTARLAELKKKSDDVDNEAATLSQKTAPTDADKARITAISMQRTNAVRTLAKEESDRRDALRKLETETLGEVENELLKLVERVAKDMKLPYIYERRAVLFGGTDITEDVLKKLPK